MAAKGGVRAVRQPSCKSRFLRTLAGKSRRIADVADSGLGRVLLRAESGPLGVAACSTSILLLRQP